MSLPWEKVLTLSTAPLFGHGHTGGSQQRVSCWPSSQQLGLSPSFMKGVRQHIPVFTALFYVWCFSPKKKKMFKRKESKAGRTRCTRKLFRSGTDSQTRRDKVRNWKQWGRMRDELSWELGVSIRGVAHRFSAGWGETSESEVIWYYNPDYYE